METDLLVLTVQGSLDWHLGMGVPGCLESGLTEINKTQSTFESTQRNEKGKPKWTGTRFLNINPTPNGNYVI